MNEIKPTAVKPVLRIPRITDITATAVLFLISRTTALGMFPFGAAFFAAVYDKSIAYIGIIAVCAGIITSAGLSAVPKYLIAAILYWLFTKMYRRSNEVIQSAVCGGSVLLGGAVMMFAGFNGLYDIFLLCTESIISALMYIIFRRSRIISDDFSKRGRMSQEEYISAAITIGAVIAGLNGITIGPASVANIAAVYAILVTALNTSVAISGCTGLCIGFMSAMSSSDAVLMMGVYSLGALFASFMNSFKKIGCAIGCISGVAVTLIYIKNIYDVPLNMIDTFMGVMLFLFTPKIVHEYMRTFFTKSMQIESVSPNRRMREYLTMRLRKMGEAFNSLHECFMSVSEGRLKKYSDDIGTILDETADRVCSGCKMCGKCWQTDFRRTYKNVLELIGVIETEGGISQENIPPHFCEKCIRADSFIHEINHVYELYKRDVLRRSDAVVTRNLISAQYGELNKMFSGMANDIEEGFSFLEDEEERIVDGLDKLGIAPYEVSAVESMSGCCEVYLRLPPITNQNAVEGVISDVLNRSMGFEKTEEGLSKYVSKPNYTLDTAVLQLPQSGSKVNGDSVTVFVSDNRKFYAIAADGMGSGSEAQYESAAVLRLLTGFLKSGISIKTALGILNSALCLNMNNEMYSTVDLLCIDLYTGSAELYKIGSAETIVLSGDEIKTVSSSCTPVGILSDIQLDSKSFELAEGDIILMLTDGITEAGCAASRTDWIKKIAIKPFDNMETLAKEVMDAAVKKSRGIAKDDMSIVALRLQST